MAESAVAKHRSLLELSPAQRREQGVDDEAVVDALMEIVEHGTEDEKILTDCTFPALDLDFLTLNGDNNYPLVFRNCTFEGPISAVDADKVAAWCKRRVEVGRNPFVPRNCERGP